uniref:Probable prefoldin subunit 6 n=1 Tax=Culicoides sonorensis TaxID=179676 RepID=A0A336M9H9_CULSO
MSQSAATLEKKLQSELDALKNTQKEYEKLIQQRQLLDGQLNENKNVLDELNLLKESNQVFKLFGPILIKQTLEESKQNVTKRVDYINKELNRCQDQISALDKKQDQHHTSTLRVFEKIPIYIYENHNEVLEPIYDCLKSRHLPFTGNFLIHFDSHPDLCRPENMPACFVFDRILLLDAVNIESWILPPIYGGHVDHVVWMKPSWAGQIPDGSYDLEVGEWNKEIYVHSNLDYYISEGSYCQLEELKNRKKWKLESIDFKNELKLNEDFLNKTELPYILDIDLDFFSTKNPFLNIYSRIDAYNRLKQIYIIPKTYNKDEEKSIISYSMQRRTHLKYLESIFKDLENGKEIDKLEPHPTDPNCFEHLKQLITDLQRHYEKEEIDYEIIHNAGCTCDTIDLPHHESTKEEITSMILDFKTFLKALKGPPTIITISRSALDDYCPPNVVDFIQESVLDVLHSVFYEKLDEAEFRYFELESD